MKYKINTRYNGIKICQIPRDMIYYLAKIGILRIITERANRGQETTRSLQKGPVKGFKSSCPEGLSREKKSRKSRTSKVLES